MSFRTVTSLGLLCLAAGCSRSPMRFLTPPEPPVVWPAQPDQPRVRYVGSLAESKDIGAAKSFGEVWNELLYGPPPPRRLVSPQAVAVNAAGDKLAVADVNGKCVHLFDMAAQTYTALVQVGQPLVTQADGDNADGAGATALESPVAVAWAGDCLWAADSMLHALALFEAGRTGRWIGADHLKRPSGMAYCAGNQLCYVSDAGAHRVLAFDLQGRLVARFGSRGTGPGQFNTPSHVCCGPDDSLVIADSLNFRVQQIGLDGTPLGMFGRNGDAAGDFALPKGVAVDSGGRIWVVDTRFENVQAFTPDGRLLMAFGKEGHGPGEFWLPAGICIDRQNRMWIADRENGRVQVFALLQ